MGHYITKKLFKTRLRITRRRRDPDEFQKLYVTFGKL